MSSREDTIVAPITAAGSAAVSVVRVSGTRVPELIRSVCDRADEVLHAPRHTVYSTLRDAGSGEPIDQGLAVFFQAPNSFTGEDTLELHFHGSPYILRRFLEGCSAFGIRSARPGEFTERAFLNGKLDLAQAEAVAELVAAETEMQAKVAREQLDGRLSRAISDLGDPLRSLLAEIEAGIDFPEEGIDPETAIGWRRSLDRVRATIGGYIETYNTGRICRDGASVVIAGLPNAGKSSLLNALVGTERAIVTSIAGTTRDTIEEWISLGGILIRLWDTAGLEKQGYEPDPIEKIGIEMGWKKVAQSDLVLYVHDSSTPFEPTSEPFARVAREASRVLIVANKSDQPQAIPLQSEQRQTISLSALTNQGLDDLRTIIPAILLDAKVLGEGRLLITTERHREALASASAALSDASRDIDQSQPAEIVALSIRSALHALNDIIGITTTEDILGLIFSKFCIGK